MAGFKIAPVVSLLEKNKAVEARLGWIYDFWAALKPYAYVREEDNVVILPPNLVYKTNKTGVYLVRHIENGGKFSELPDMTQEKTDQIHDYFMSIRSVYRQEPVSLDSVVYDFSFTKLPVLGEIAVTYRCNNACRFCYAGCADAAQNSCSKYPELNTQSLKALIDIFRDKCKIPFFSFTGGEPLLRNDLEDLIAYAVSRDLRVNLISNGTLATKERAGSLYASGLRTAQISLEGTDSATHDYLTAIPGSFKKTLEGIHALQEAGIAVQTNTTLNAFNKSNICAMPQFVSSLGVTRMSMNLYIPTGTLEFRESLAVSYSECAGILPLVQKAAKQANMTFYWYSPLPMCIYNPIANGFGNKNCAACDGLVSVAPDGSLLPCSS